MTLNEPPTGRIFLAEYVGDNARIEKAVTSQSAAITCLSSRPLGNYQRKGYVGLKMITTPQLPTGFKGPPLLAWLVTVICKHS
jgi:hypothetical protein